MVLRKEEIIAYKLVEEFGIEEIYKELGLSFDTEKLRYFVDLVESEANDSETEFGFLKEIYSILESVEGEIFNVDGYYTLKLILVGNKIVIIVTNNELVLKGSIAKSIFFLDN